MLRNPCNAYRGIAIYIYSGIYIYILIDLNNDLYIYSDLKSDI